MSFKNTNCYIIAEIGQNHQGSMAIAIEMIKEAKRIGANCVKFQKSTLNSKFTREALLRPYQSPHSWGATYGEHKAYLEFSNQQFIELQQHARNIGIDFTASAMDVISLDFLYMLKVPFIKIGSGDAQNELLLRNAAHLRHPLVISTGMCNMDDVRNVYKIISAEHTEFALLHCVSSYPTPDDQLNLNVIKTFIEEFPDITIGYSGHEIGTSPTLAAFYLGAKVIERHMTLDKTWKGSDHSCSLTPNEFGEMIQRIRSNNINIIEFPLNILGDCKKSVQESEMSCIKKLGKSLVASRNLEKGQILKLEDFCIKVAEPFGVSCRFLMKFIGRKLLCDIKEDSCILWKDVE